MNYKPRDGHKRALGHINIYVKIKHTHSAQLCSAGPTDIRPFKQQFYQDELFFD